MSIFLFWRPKSFFWAVNIYIICDIYIISNAVGFKLNSVWHAVGVQCGHKPFVSMTSIKPKHSRLEQQQKNRREKRLMCIMATVFTPAMPFCHVQLLTHPVFDSSNHFCRKNFRHVSMAFKLDEYLLITTTSKSQYTTQTAQNMMTILQKKTTQIIIIITRINLIHIMGSVSFFFSLNKQEHRQASWPTLIFDIL